MQATSFHLRPSRTVIRTTSAHSMHRCCVHCVTSQFILVRRQPSAPARAAPRRHCRHNPRGTHLARPPAHTHAHAAPTHVCAHAYSDSEYVFLQRKSTALPRESARNIQSIVKTMIKTEMKQRDKAKSQAKPQAKPIGSAIRCNTHKLMRVRNHV